MAVSFCLHRLTKLRRFPALLILLSCCASADGIDVNVCSAGYADSSCWDCLLRNPQCAWCSMQNFTRLSDPLQSRCNLVEDLLQAGCPRSSIESPRNRIQVIHALPLSAAASLASRSPVQQSPQEITLNLRPGEPLTFQVDVRPVEDYPVDVYYLMDLSLSMQDDLAKMSRLGTTLAAQMANLTSNLRLGFGAFVDKPSSPFAFTAPAYLDNPCIGYKRAPKCAPTYAFHHLLPLTDQVAQFNEQVQRVQMARNNDASEGGFDAILQTSVCSERIGWRKEATHLLVFATDAASHLALDGQLAGITQPNDGLCHLDEKGSYTAANTLDYPSLGLLSEKLAENNINLIFAVTRAVFHLYKNYTDLMPGTTAGILANDSSNVIQLIMSAFNNIRSQVQLEVRDQPEELSLTFKAMCQNGSVVGGQRGCNDLRVGDTATFHVTVKAKSCHGSDQEQQFNIKPAGFLDTLLVKVHMHCECSCQGKTEEKSSHCHGRGRLECGDCFCHPGYFGHSCECEDDGWSTQNKDKVCRAEGQQTMCSGRGDCVCGQCNCFHNEFGRISGPFCECDDFSCFQHNGVLCSGHGECICGECMCMPDWIGPSCSCSLITDGCQSVDGKPCSGRGLCKCGRCECTQPGVFGITCERCSTCVGVCTMKRHCVECRLFGQGQLSPEACSHLCHEDVVLVETLETTNKNAVMCIFKSNDSCKIHFVYSEEPNGKSVLTVLKTPDCLNQAKDDDGHATKEDESDEDDESI
uniref:integrin beta-5-like isoform X2 n=1 Tax=Myxine glutinosa TaxID=7769 RepID=UPI00358E9F2A